MKTRKYAILGLILALVFILSPVATHAQTIQDLLDQIAKLQAQLNTLLQQQSQPVAPISGGGTAWCFNWTRDLSVGSTGVDVSALQTALQKLGFFPATSPITGYFGPLTQNALAAWQGSIGLPNSGYFGTVSREKMNSIFGCLTTPAITVLSPNGGEGWFKGTTQKISWKSNFEKVAPIEIWLSSASTCQKGEICPPTIYASYLIGKTDTSYSSFAWQVGKASGTEVPSGAYNLQVRVVDVNGYSLAKDSSDSYFKIYDSSTTNKPPVISGVSGPTTLEVGKSGTWSVIASDPENGPLSYSVIWGDEPKTGSTAGLVTVQQTATFTHTYSRAGTFYPAFTVTDNAGQSAKTSLSVVVGGGTTTNNPPKLEMPYPLNTYVGQELTFGLRALDADNDKLLYGLEFGDGMGIGIVAPPNCQNGYLSGQVVPVKHTYWTAGAFRLKVTVIDCRGGSNEYAWDLIVSSGTQPAPSIISSNPPNGAIDARQDKSTYASASGWKSIELKFSGSISGILPSDFAVTVSGGTAPVVVGTPFRANPVGTSAVMDTLSVDLDRPIPVNQRTRITYKPSNSSICLGYLPGDVDQSGMVAPADILEMVDIMNGKNVPLYVGDVDRSGVIAPADQLAFTDILNATNGKTLPACPGGVGTLSPSSQLANTLSSLNSLLQTLKQSLAR